MWPTTPGGFRRHEKTVDVGVTWDEARSLLLAWAVKTRSGFRIDTAGKAGATVRDGTDMWLRFAVGPVTVREPIRVTAVVDTPLRCGFSYGTLEGHPVCGEEAFIVHRASSDDPVHLTIRSLTRPAPSGLWRYSFPVVLVAQRWFRKRYLSSLDC